LAAAMFQGSSFPRTWAIDPSKVHNSVE
jgi:hypothetical protein